jgi:nitrite reductase/ring-hydroxylating ferredoxin subunit
VNRTAWEPEDDEFHVATKFDDLVEGRLTAGEITVQGNRLPLTLHGSEVLALGAVCSHAGGPLNRGLLVNETRVQCPWHGSRFDLRAGRVVHRPATMPQPTYRTRIREGIVEVRRTPCQ